MKYTWESLKPKTIKPTALTRCPECGDEVQVRQLMRAVFERGQQTQARCWACWLWMEAVNLTHREFGDTPDGREFD